MISKRLLIATLLVVGALAACGKDDARPASTGDPTTTTSEGETDEQEPEAEPTTLELTGTEYAYGGAPTEPVAAGVVEVTLQNDGAEEHQATIVRFREGRSPADLGAIGADPSTFSEVVETFGGPNAVAPAAAYATTQTLEPGSYAFVCFIPSPDGQPHAAKGMVAPFTVEGEVPEASVEGEGDARIVLQDHDFGFGDDALVEAGDYRVVNDGPQAHEIAVYAPADGETTDDIIEFFSGEAGEGPPPFVGAGGVAALDTGRTVEGLELAVGEYVFVCFLPDAEDGAPHFTKGMIQAVSVE